MCPSFVVHCHVPKTGGSALNRRLIFPRYCQGGTYQLYRYVFECAQRLPRRHVSRAMRAFAAAGHVPYGFFERVYPGALHVSVLREPVARGLSFLNFVLNTPDHNVHERLPPGIAARAGDDPDAFVAAVLAEPRLAVVQSNVQTRLVGGCARLSDRAVDRDDLERALAHAARPDYLIGTQEGLDAFIAGLEALLPPGPGRAPAGPPKAVEEKRLPHRLDPGRLAPRTLERLRAANDLDLRLYERVAADPPRLAAAA